jgi:hypothetical protein
MCAMEQWPTPLAMAKAMADLLTERLDDFYAERIVLSRDEAALCTGIDFRLGRAARKGRTQALKKCPTSAMRPPRHRHGQPATKVRISGHVCPASGPWPNWAR